MTCSPAAFCTGLGTYDPLPLIPTIETVTEPGVLDPGVVGDDLPPPHRDAETAAANTVMRINDDRMMLFLQED
jgi:hypothetical protein